MGELTVKLKEYTEAKVQKLVEEYQLKHREPEAPPPPVDERTAAPVQTALGLDVPTTAETAGNGYGGGAL